MSEPCERSVCLSGKRSTDPLATTVFVLVLHRIYIFTPVQQGKKTRDCSYNGLDQPSRGPGLRIALSVSALGAGCLIRQLSHESRLTPVTLSLIKPPFPPTVFFYMAQPYTQPMPSRRSLPQELVDKIIDELAEAYHDPDLRELHPDDLNTTRETLHACMLVSKNWTRRSRSHLFKEIEIRADSGLVLPPESVMPHVTKLEMQLGCGGYRLFPSRDIFTPFYAAPITHLGITAGAPGVARVYLVECVAALSTTLQISDVHNLLSQDKSDSRHRFDASKAQAASSPWL